MAPAIILKFQLWAEKWLSSSDCLALCGQYIQNDASLLIPTEAGLHYQKLRRIYLADRFVRPAIVSFITTIATMAATYIAANVSPWFKALLEAIQSIFQ